MPSTGVRDDAQFPEYDAQCGHAVPAEGLVRPVTSVQHLQFPKFVLTDGAGEDVLTVNGVHMAEGNVDEPFVALTAILLQGAKEAHGRQELIW